MKISTEIGSLAKRVGEIEAIKMYSKAGFDYFDYSMFSMASYNKVTKELNKTGRPLEERESALKLTYQIKDLIKELGIKCNQAHAPYPSYSEKVFKYIPLAIECASILKAKYIVIHPCNNSTPEENAKMFLSLLPYAKKFHIGIVVENMWNFDHEKDIAINAACSNEFNFKEHLDLLPKKYFNACVDIGHAEMRGLNTSASKMIRYLGDRVKCIHVHDNDQHLDCHQLPFTMNIDFNSVIDALKAINYKGDMTLEVDKYLDKFDDEHLFEGVINMANTARKLADMFEKQ